MRWWDGAEWSPHAAAPATYPSRPVDGFAVAALVLGVVGVSVLAIVFGFVASRRIKRSAGQKGGSGMATAGIALGFTWLGVIGVVAALAATGAIDVQVLNSKNADDYSGAKAPVAKQVDAFEAAMDDNDGRRICRELLSVRYAQSFDTETGGCPGYWSSVIGTDEAAAEIDVHAIDINGNIATADVDEGGLTETFTFVHDGTEWRLDWIVVDES
jgi:hypothetical protein